MSFLPRGSTATVLSHSTNPYLNLALETYLFSTQPQSHLLLFYRNRPTVIIGRNQNPFSQVNLSYINFLRRYSGGGTVYHDLGNVNFSVKMPRHEFNRQTYAVMVVRAMERRGVTGSRVTERGDITFSNGEVGYKISGSAYKVSKDIAYHHGTMLLNSDLDELRRALRVDDRIMIRDKGVDSVRASHVGNVPFPGESNDAKFHNFVQSVREEFEDMHGRHDFVELQEEEIKPLHDVQRNVDQLMVFSWFARFDRQSWEWRFGQTPEFTDRTTLDEDVFPPEGELTKRDQRYRVPSNVGSLRPLKFIQLAIKWKKRYQY